jgi:hypothetical protein
MAPRSRRPDTAELGHRIWDYLRGQAENLPGEFRPDTRDDITGWLWEGAVASLIREAIPGITDSELRRAREYLNASGMVVNVRGHQRGAGSPQWFIRSSWHQGPGGHVHVVATHQPGQPTAPAASQPAAGNEREELAGPPRQDIANTLESLIQQVSDLQSDNDRLRGDNDRLHAEIERIRALARDAGREIARRASQMLADAEDRRPPTSQPSPLELLFVPGRCSAPHPGAPGVRASRAVPPWPRHAVSRPGCAPANESPGIGMRPSRPSCQGGLPAWNYRVKYRWAFGWGMMRGWVVGAQLTIAIRKTAFADLMPGFAGWVAVYGHDPA